MYWYYAKCSSLGAAESVLLRPIIIMMPRAVALLAACRYRVLHQIRSLTSEQGGCVRPSAQSSVKGRLRSSSLLAAATATCAPPNSC